MAKRIRAVAIWRAVHSAIGAIEELINGPVEPETAASAAIVESLELRQLLSATAPTFVLAGPAATLAAPFTPAQIRKAYQLDALSFGSVTADGRGQTIALIEAYNDPNIFRDANQFSAEFGLPAFTLSGDGPTLNVENQYGSGPLPVNGPRGVWDVEESLDVEVAHTVAPLANILVVEGNAYSTYAQFIANETDAINTARNTTGVTTVSMSFGVPEFSGETATDSIFNTPAGHAGVTFFASSGDFGAPGGYPANSPNVVAVGGTTLTINSDGTYGGEIGWSRGSDWWYSFASGGDISSVEPQPFYQDRQAAGITLTQRTIPDVAWLADLNSGVYVLDTYYLPTVFGVGGTSVASPMWAALTADIDQGRALNGLSSLDGVSQTLPLLYNLPASDFHDITVGNNGFAAGVGYDLVTGRGSPNVPALVSDMSTDNVIFVDSSAPGLNNGTSWANAYTSLQQALTVALTEETASPGNIVIDVAQGTYYPTAGTSRTATFQLLDNVALYGGFAGYGAANPGANDRAAYPTILSADIGTVGNDSDNSYHVVTATGTNSTAVLDGFIIAHGNASGSGSQSDGGGIYDSGGTPTINRCTFSDDAATGSGGGFYLSAAAMNLPNLTFSNDSAAYGGGLYLSYAPALLINSTFSNDSAGSDGGGLYNANSSPSLTQCTFTNDSAGNGGGIYNVDSSPNLSDCTFSDDTATNGGGIADGGGAAPTITDCAFTLCAVSGDGGAIYNRGAYNGYNRAEQASPTIIGSTFASDSASHWGGAIYNGYSVTAKITSSTFNGDSATHGGGAITNQGGDGEGYSTYMTLAGCSFEGDGTTSGNGSAILNRYYCYSTVDNSTFTNNSAPTGGGAIGDDFGSTGTSFILVNNSILWNDAGGELEGSHGSGYGGDPDFPDGGITIAHCDIQGGVPSGNMDINDGGANINADPQFVGAPGNLQLQIISPCINTGINSAVPTGLTTDLAGNPRIIGTAVDMGAFECQSIPIYVDSLATSGANDGTSWSNAYVTLETALNAVTTDEVTHPHDKFAILIGQGTYYPTTASDRTATFRLANGESLLGGYAGLGTANPNARSATAYPTILSGDIGTHGVTSDNSYHVVTDISATATLDGLTIEAGNADGSGAAQNQGGGIYAFAGYVGGWAPGTLTMTDCTLSNDLATCGGALYVTGGNYLGAATINMTDCALTGDSASQGGAIYDSFGVLNLNDSTISDDSATGNGGALYVQEDDNQSVTISHCTLDGDTASGVGGAIYNVYAQYYSGVTYSHRYARAPVNIVNSVLDADTAQNGGGAIADQDGIYMTATNCTLEGDGATDGDGGAILNNHYAYGKVNNCTFTNNSALAGGAIAEKLTNYCGYIQVDNSILWGDSGGELDASLASTATGYTAIRVEYSDVEGGIPSNPLIVVGAGNINAGPDFVGAPGNLQLQGHSPCVNTGNNNDIPAGVTTDLAGNPRVTADVVDMGAFECQNVIPIYVDSSATLGANNGSSWANAFTSLQAGLSAALTDETAHPTEQIVILVGQGTYYPTTGSSRTATFQLQDWVSILGGYAGTGATNPDARNFAAYPTILSGDIGTLGSSSDNSYHVVTATGADATAILDGFTIENGNANGAGSGQNDGGGIYNAGGSPVIKNCTFSYNSAAEDGGGLYESIPVAVTLDNCSFNNNSAANGGGIFVTGSTISLNGCTFSTNSATNGGGIYIANATADLTAVNFSSNVASYDGGGIYSENASLTLGSSVLSGNTAVNGGALFDGIDATTVVTGCTFAGDSASQNGGAINNNGNQPYSPDEVVSINTATIVTSTFTADTASNQGGAIYNSYSTVGITDCKFDGDSAHHGGGAVSNQTGDVTLGTYSTIVNCQFVGNQVTVSGDGSAILNGYYAFSTVDNSTFTGNSAPADGGTIADDFGSTGTSFIQVNNSILWNNSGGELEASHGPGYGWDPDFPDGGIVVSYTDVQGGVPTGNMDITDGGNNINADPEFVGSLGNLQLLPTSPCVNTGHNSSIPSGITTDLAGNPRTVYNVVDRGAFECQSIPVYVDHLATSGANNGTSWANAFTSLQAGLSAANADKTLYPGHQIIVVVGQGTYYPTTGASRTATFQLENGVSILGGYAGLGASNPDARNSPSYPTILSGDIGTIGNTSDNSYHVVTASGTDSSAVLDGFTIEYGNANGGGSLGNGGGIYDSGGSPTINNCAVIHDSATGDGGGIYVSGGTLAMSNLTLTNDSAGQGGGIYSTGSSLTLTDCTLSSDMATGDGGAMYSTTDRPVTLNDCTLDGDSAGGTGGGMYNLADTLLMTDCTFDGDAAQNGGGAIYNQANNGFPETYFAMTNCVFDGDSTVHGDGGAIHNGYYCYGTADNCTFTGNSAPAGGAIGDDFGCAGTSYIKLENCILWGDTGGELELSRGPGFGGYPNPFPYSDGGIIILYSDVQGGIPTGNIDIANDGGNINLDPQFVDSPTDLTLQPASPCVNAGNNVFVPSGITTDLAGNPRILDGSVDMGAYEANVTTVYVDYNATGLGDGTSWANAYPTLGGALSAIGTPTSPVRIEVGQGTYMPTTGADRTATFQLVGNISILGGYSGNGTYDPDIRNIAAYPTILSGDIGTAGNTSDNSYHVVRDSDTCSGAILDGLTIAEGNANGSGTVQNDGGGILNQGMLTIQGCTFIGDVAANQGGAIYNSPADSYTYATLVIANSTFDGDSAGHGGGAVANQSDDGGEARSTITNCDFVGNRVTISGDGSAILNGYYSYGTVDNSTLTGNSAPTGGGAIADDFGSTGTSFIQVNNSILWNNSGGELEASHGPGYGWDPDMPDGGITIAYSDVQGGVPSGNMDITSGGHNLDADPKFVRNANVSSGDFGDQELLGTSPLIDVGANAAVPAGVFNDLAGNFRFANGTVDIGAYEYQGGPLATIATFTVSHGSSRVNQLTIVLNEPSALQGLTLYSAGGVAMPFQVNTTDDQTYVITFPSYLNGAYTGNALPSGQFSLVVQPLGASQEYFVFS